MALKGILSKGQLSEMAFPFPPLELQNQFSVFVKKTEKTKANINRSLEKLETLKKALMQEYFGWGNKMEEYKLTLGMEPTDDYKKAKQDLIQAMRSIQKLSPQQQQMLAEELFGAANVMVLSQILRQYLRWI